MKAQKYRKRLKRVRKQKKTKAGFFGTTLPYMPDEIVNEILLRLPATSLRRFRAVCKPWCALISDPRFVKQHLHVANKRRHIVNYLRMHDVNCIRTQSPSQEYLSLTSINNRASQIGIVNFEYPSSYLEKYMKLVGSCDGMLLISTPADTFLWNPSTKECKLFKRMPKTNQDKTYLSGLGYDSSVDDYKAVRFEKGQFAMLFLLNSKSVRWKKVDYQHDFPYNISDLDCLGLTVNGAPNWLVTEHKEDQQIESKLIIYFDFVAEKFKRLPMPPMSLSLYNSGKCNLAVLGGCLCIVHYNDVDNTVEVWLMKDYGVKESWTKLFVFRRLIWHLMPLGFTKNGEVLMVVNNRELVTYNLKTNKEQFVAASEKDLKFNAAAAYVESLVSPHRRARPGITGKEAYDE